MTSSRRARIAEEIAAETKEHGELLPPWARHPEIPAGSIGWRMGYGESYQITFDAWFRRKHWRREAKIRYLRRYPAPKSWKHFVASCTKRRWKPVPTVRELEGLGLFADDVSFRYWTALHGASPPRPFGFPARLGSYASMNPRELTFLGRWAGEARTSARFDRWLAMVPKPPKAWVAFWSALSSGQVPSTLPLPPWEQVALHLAASGEVPPPWTAGHVAPSVSDPRSLEGSFGEAWLSWVLRVFDDQPSWRAYLRRYGEVPADWGPFLKPPAD